MISVLFFAGMASNVMAANQTDAQNSLGKVIYGDFILQGQNEKYFEQIWDLTKSELVISYSLDLTGITPPTKDAIPRTLVGVSGGASGWMTSSAPALSSDNANDTNFDPEDKHVLGDDEFSYDVLVDENSKPYIASSLPIGNPAANYGIMFDRDGFDSSQTQIWGMTDGRTYNTQGKYQVKITLQAIDLKFGAMFATVNGIQTGFYANTVKNSQPEYYPVGKTVSGDLTGLKVFLSFSAPDASYGAVQVTDLTVVGELATTSVKIDIKPGSDPNSINLKSKGVVAVALLTEESFDATTIDQATVVFASAKPVRWTIEDVDGDGDLDVVFHFNTQELKLDGTSTEATLTGNILSTGQSIQGTDTVRILPQHKQN